MKKLSTIAFGLMLGGLMTAPVWAQTSNPPATHAPAKKKTSHKKVTKKRATKHTKRAAKKTPTSSTKKNG